MFECSQWHHPDPVTAITGFVMNNPLLKPWTQAHGLPPFAQLQPEHFAPALRHAMDLHRLELDALARQTEPATFDNTVAAFDRCGRTLSRIEATFDNLCSSHTNSALQAVQMETAGPLSAHASAVYMNQALFQRVDAVHRQRAAAGLTPEQQRLVERVHLDFVRAGAQLTPQAATRYAAVMQQLAQLTTRFAQNVLHDEADFVLPLTTEDELAGLPDFLRASARQAAADRGMASGVHAITLSRSLVVPFLTYSTRRDLREQAWRAWVGRGEHDGPHDNRELARDILRLRQEQARIHGRASYSEHALTDTMAGTQEAVKGLLQQVWPRALQAVAREREALLEVMRMEGSTEPLEAWDWRFWAEKVRLRTYALDDAQIKPYFPLPQVVQAAFDCATRLFGLRFVPRKDLSVYHPDVAAYEVFDADGALRAIFMQDNFARPSKRSGAWMSSLRWQSRNEPGGGAAVPIILNNNNFAKGAGTEPTLLSLDDVRTLFHEFGHGLHGMLSDVQFERLSGTQVLRDFVELPSQIFEHWLSEPEVLKKHARHWRTGEVMPDALIQRMLRARLFSQGYETVRYTASALADMAVHSLEDTEPPADLCAFEAAVLAEAGLPPAVGLNHRLVHFQHLFSGASYAAGYYVYLWAEVLDADGYDAFVEAGDPFNPEVAARLRRYIYGSGNSLEPAQAFAAFRGRAPSVEPMLRKKGLLEAEPA
jgi:peptidyl-dipeptidase Dcp